MQNFPVRCGFYRHEAENALIISMQIPPVYFSLREEPDRGEYRATLDGKQRLTSIYRFFEG
jgi:hypothetical protein